MLIGAILIIMELVLIMQVERVTATVAIIANFAR